MDLMGTRFPVVPRASRSARGRGSIWKKVDHDQIRAFDILATVAGSFLQEGENSAPLNTARGTEQHFVDKNTDKREWKDVGQSMELKASDQRSCDDSAFAFLAMSEGNHQNESEMISFDKSVAIVNSKNACKSSSSKVVEVSPVYGKRWDYKVDGVNKRILEVEAHKVRSSINRTVCDRISLMDAMEGDCKPPVLVSPNSCFKASMVKAGKIVNPFSGCQNNLEVVSRDDDENSYGCSQRGPKIKAYRPPLHMGDRKLRKPLAYKPCRAASNLKEREYLNTDGKTKPFYRNWKTCYARQRIYPFKRRKLLHRNPLSKYGRGFSCKGLFNSFGKGMTGDNGNAERKVSSSVAGQQTTLKTGECNVKLSIKSFRVPELCIEIPATATVGSLKRAVMDAATAVLGDGLHVGLLLQGKKVKDDSKTLRQTGIYRDKKLHSLRFMLEPKHEQILPLCTEDPSFLPAGGISPCLIRHSTTLMLEPGTSNASPSLPVPNLSDRVGNELDTPPIFTGISTEEIMPESKALVAVPAMGMEALSAVPYHNKSRHRQFAQRRIRRPFSVSEVEALVQAVEKLGTGRWRDVKLHAFDCAKHRTYVDLKDKWKTLVHTAKISPQQRRGQPVPQDLLDRVLASHAYWSYEHAKLQMECQRMKPNEDRSSATTD